MYIFMISSLKYYKIKNKTSKIDYLIIEGIFARVFKNLFKS